MPSARSSVALTGARAALIAPDRTGVYDAPGVRRIGRHNRRVESARRRPCGVSKTGLWVIIAVLVGSMLGPSAAEAQKKTLVVALNQDPDILDPTLSRTYVGRIIFAQMCEKLYEIDENLQIFPQLAAALPAISDGGKTVTIKLRRGVKFNDGTPMNAEAVKFSLDRHREMKGSNRRSELEPVDAVEVVDPLTIRLRLKAPFSPLVGDARRPRRHAGVAGRGQQARREVRHRAGLRGAVELRRARAAGPHRAREVHPLLRSGPGASSTGSSSGSSPTTTCGWPICARATSTSCTRWRPPTRPASRRRGGSRSSSVTGHRLHRHHHQPAQQDRQDPARRAISARRSPTTRACARRSSSAIDREALNQVAWDGQYTPGCTPISPISPFYDKSRKCPARDVAQAPRSSWPTRASPAATASR